MDQIKVIINKVFSNPLVNAILYMLLSLVVLLLAQNAGTLVYTIALIGAIFLQFLAFVQVAAFFRIRKLQKNKPVKRVDRKKK